MVSRLTATWTFCTLHVLVSLSIRWLIINFGPNLNMQHGIFCHGTLIMHVGLVSFMHDPLLTVHGLNPVADLGGIQGCERTPLWTLVNYYS